MIWLKDATLTQLKICKKCWHNVQKVASSYASSTALLYFPQQSSDRVNISNRMCEWHFAKASYNTGPEWFSLVWCWWQGPISGMSLDMIFTILIRLSDLVLSRDNTITVLKIMHFLGFFNLCMCAIGVPKMFCLLGHFFFSFKGLSYKVLHDKMSFTIVYLLRDRTSSCKLTSPSPSWSAREKIVWISWSLKPDFLKLLLSSW